ncbi:Class II Aminoacyl-tRNA synthetase/Biotinyl protein ligase (BPL) and lipoyl protein ligase (LPL) [Septoria linicola]|uniref:serine--tRNA ligase n=1 Tax=Septoria linicola TaxID=215465 RepID=A0A9Q9AMS6_9PEZI|nr:Class II Aminoacyl-tRNA synthetase/Biotinyl protein ligase (BPL) and lipoyl protein ligase (LPL) [Septoria linicola]
MSLPYICSSCRRQTPTKLLLLQQRTYTRPSFAPKPILDIKHIRNNPGLYEQNCLDRNYPAVAKNGWKTLELHERLRKVREESNEWRRRNNVVGGELGRLAGKGDGSTVVGEGERRKALLEEAKMLKEKLTGYEAEEKAMQEEMEKLALELPNLSSLETPVGEEPALKGVIGEKDKVAMGNQEGESHVDIGKELDLLDFEASATTSGWGWYFLKNEAALLEQALIQYALSVAMKRGWKVMTPPSLVYSHIASACGFMPRDQNGETQIYNIEQQHQHQHQHQPGQEDRPHLVLTGTAEIPFAGSQANKTLRASDLPLKVIGPSRCYRAEAGARGVDTKGLYRVHEFTKVEMFAWTLPPPDHSSSDRFGDIEASSPSEEIFAEVLSIQTEILTSLGLHAKILEMPKPEVGDEGEDGRRRRRREVGMAAHGEWNGDGGSKGAGLFVGEWVG